MFSGTIATANIIRPYIISGQVWKVAIDQNKGDMVGMQLPDRLIIGAIAAGEDDQAHYLIGAQPRNVPRLLLLTFLGVGKSYMIAVRLGRLLDPNQNIHIQLRGRRSIQHQADVLFVLFRLIRMSLWWSAHKCPSPLHPFEQSLTNQQCQGLAHSVATDLVLLCKL